MKELTMSSWRDRSIQAMVTGVVGGASVLIAGFLVLHDHERALVTSRAQVEHSHTVLGELGTISQDLDRLQFNRAAVTAASVSEASQESSTVATSIRLFSETASLKNLLVDDVQQSSRSELLIRCVVALSQAAPPVGPSFSEQMEAFDRCRKIQESLRSEERSVLTLRNGRAIKADNTFRRESMVYMVLSLTGLLSLFTFLVLGARQRMRLGNDLLRSHKKLLSTVSKLEEQTTDLQVLAIMRDEFQLCVSLKEAHQSGGLFISQLMPESTGVVYLLNESRNLVERVTSWGDTLLLDNYPDVSAPECCCALRSGRFRTQRIGQSEVSCTHFNHGPDVDYVCFPLAAQGDALGFVSMCSRIDVAPDGGEQHFRSVRQVVELMALTIASLRLKEKLQNQSMRDPLTGLFNRSFMEIAFERELRRASRKESTLAVLMLDVDHFKKFNDTYGHAAGDTMLRSVAASFRRCVRSEDIVCRYGGEEFAIILPEIPLGAAIDRAESIRAAVNDIQIQFQTDQSPQMTISIGLAHYPTSGSSIDQLLRAADKALYIAKREGRDQVVCAEGLHVAEVA